MKRRTTLELDGDLVSKAMKLSGTKTKTEAIELSLRELVRKYQRELLIQSLGTFDIYDYDEFMQIRHMEKDRRDSRDSDG